MGPVGAQLRRVKETRLLTVSEVSRGDYSLQTTDH